VEALHATFVGHRYPPHCHDAWTIALVDVGAAAFDLERERHVALAGDIFLIPPGAVHTGQAATENGYSYRVLYLDPESLAAGGDTTTPDRHGLPVVVEARDCALALHHVHALLDLPGRTLEQGEALASALQLLRPLLLRGAERHVAGHLAVGRARDYIHENWRRDFSLRELSEAVGVSPFHLSRLFREQIGMPPSAYRRTLRIQSAQRLLRAGETPIDCALACGFYDQSHLSRHFHAVTGVTPRAYASASGS
jgi:AraC-like DNA-binding protein